MGVQSFEALKARNRNQEVPPGVAHQVLHLALVVALARAGEAILEQVVGLKLRECPRALALPPSQDARHRNLRVVVEN